MAHVTGNMSRKKKQREKKMLGAATGHDLDVNVSVVAPELPIDISQALFCRHSSCVLNVGEERNVISTRPGESRVRYQTAIIHTITIMFFNRRGMAGVIICFFLLLFFFRTLKP